MTGGHLYSDFSHYKVSEHSLGPYYLLKVINDFSVKKKDGQQDKKKIEVRDKFCVHRMQQ